MYVILKQQAGVVGTPITVTYCDNEIEASKICLNLKTYGADWLFWYEKCNV